MEPTSSLAAALPVVEADLRALATEARRRFPLVKDAAETALLQVRIREGEEKKKNPLERERMH